MDSATYGCCALDSKTAKGERGRGRAAVNCTGPHYEAANLASGTEVGATVPLTAPLVGQSWVNNWIMARWRGGSYGVRLGGRSKVARSPVV